MQIVDNKALLITTKKHAQIAALIPRSKVIGTKGELGRVLVHWGLDETQVLRNLRIKDVPSPILREYSWPGVFSPFDHQRETAAFLATHPRCFVFNDAGTGKTSAAAWAADYLMTKGKVKRVLIVGPVSILETAWRSDLFKTVMHRSAAVAIGDRKARQRILGMNTEFVIINFDGIKVVYDELAAGGFDLIIVDEANAVKSVTTDRWKMLNKLITPQTRLWMMTGTPASQSPVDAYGLAKLVNPGSVPKFFGAFRDQVMVKVTQFKFMPREGHREVVHKALQPAIRFTKDECLDLPDMLYTTREVPLTKQQQKYYDLITKQMMAVAGGEQITAQNAAGKLNKLLQIASGAAYTDEREVVEFDIQDRFDELMDIIDNTSHKVLVFVNYRHTNQMLNDKLTAAGVVVEVIHGGTSAGERGEIIKRFQSEDNPRVLLLAPAAAGHGITLTKADTVVWWGPITSTELYLQANARAHRAGQTNKVTVVHLQGSPVERRMYKMLQDKIDIHQHLVELYKEEIGESI